MSENENNPINNSENTNNTNDTNSQPTTAKKSSLGMDENVAGLLCYALSLVSGIVIFALEKESKFVKFHAMQSIILNIALIILTTVDNFIPFVGGVIGSLSSLLSFVLWILMMYKAYNNEWYKLPVLGDMAEKQINK